MHSKIRCLFQETPETNKIIRNDSSNQQKIRFHLFSKNGRKQTGIRKATVLSEGGEWGVQVTVKVKLLEVMQAENNRVTRNHCMQIV